MPLQLQTSAAQKMESLATMTERESWFRKSSQPLSSNNREKRLRCALTFNNCVQCYRSPSRCQIKQKQTLTPFFRQKIIMTEFNGVDSPWLTCIIHRSTHLKLFQRFLHLAKSSLRCEVALAGNCIARRHDASSVSKSEHRLPEP